MTDNESRAALAEVVWGHIDGISITHRSRGCYSAGVLTNEPLVSDNKGEKVASKLTSPRLCNNLCWPGWAFFIDWTVWFGLTLLSCEKCQTLRNLSVWHTCWLLGFLKLPRHDWSIKGGTVCKMVCRVKQWHATHSCPCREFSFSLRRRTTTSRFLSHIMPETKVIYYYQNC